MSSGEGRAYPPVVPDDAVKCKAYQASDQMVCDRCKMGWDVNDPYPPECNLDEGEE